MDSSRWSWLVISAPRDKEGMKVTAGVLCGPWAHDGSLEPMVGTLSPRREPWAQRWMILPPSFQQGVTWKGKPTHGAKRECEANTPSRGVGLDPLPLRHGVKSWLKGGPVPDPGASSWEHWFKISPSGFQTATAWYLRALWKHQDVTYVFHRGLCVFAHVCVCVCVLTPRSGSAADGLISST